MTGSYWALLSGGKDSVATAHYLSRRGELAGCVFIDTGIACSDTCPFVEKLCRSQGWPLRVFQAPKTYEELVRRYGFPQGLVGHSWAYGWLKERALREAKQDLGPDAVFASGARRKESARRARSVAKGFRHNYRIRIVNPIVEWSTPQVWAYLRENGLEVSPSYLSLGRSGDCLCLDPATMVRTDEGWVPISSVRPGSRVLDRLGTWTSVESSGATGCRTTVRFKARFRPWIRVTPDHPFWARPYKFSVSPYGRRLGNARWATPQDMLSAVLRNPKGPMDMRWAVGVPPSPCPGAKTGLSEAGLRLVGHFISEGAYGWRANVGHASHRRGITFTLGAGPKGRSLAEKIASEIDHVHGPKAEFTEYNDPRHGRPFIRVRSGRKSVAEWVSRFVTGRYAHEKALTPVITGATPEERAIVLDAMWEGDGSVFTRSNGANVSTYTTASRALALQVAEMGLAAGTVRGIHEAKPGAGFHTTRPGYQVRTEGHSNIAFEGDGFWWFPVSQIIVERESPVWNLSVQGDHTFVTEAGVVHNCGSFSQRGEADVIRRAYPDLAARILALEDAVRDRFPYPKNRWGKSERSLGGFTALHGRMTLEAAVCGGDCADREGP